MLEPQEISIKTQAGTEKTYILSKFPAVAGREIVAKYPLSSMPKLGDYAVNEDVMLKLMGYVAAISNGTQIKLTSRALIDNHVPDWETLGKIELAMMEYNCSFFLKEKVLSFFDVITQKVPALVSKILTDSLAQSSTPAKPPSTNSEPSTP